MQTKEVRSKPWFSKGIHISLRKRRTRFRPLFLQGNNFDKTFYQNYSDKLNKIVVLSKKIHFSSTLDQAKLTKADRASSVLDHFEAECDSIELTTVNNCFNYFVCSIGKLAHSNFSDRSFFNYLPNRVSASLYLNTPSDSKMLNVIYFLIDNKAVGHDNIPTFFVRIAATIISTYLQCFINFFLRTEYFPRVAPLSHLSHFLKRGINLTPTT